MAKNLIAQLRTAKDEGRLEGILMGLDIAAIAFNHCYHFGDKRLAVVEVECQKILDEIQTTDDADRLFCDLYKELARIRPSKESNDFFMRRYIKF